MMKRLILSAILLLASAVAALAQQGQPVRQSGTPTQRHVVCWTTTGVIQDCGTAVAPFATSFGTVGEGPTICMNSAATSGAYNRLCLGANTSSNAQISLQNFGGAPAEGLEFVINGTTIPLPSSGSPLPISAGGTGASTALGAITNLGAGIIGLPVVSSGDNDTNWLLMYQGSDATVRRINPTSSSQPTGGTTTTSNNHLFSRIIAAQDFCASGSGQTTTGTISASSTTLTLAAAIDFSDCAGSSLRPGILVHHAGAAFSVSAPSGLSVTPHGSTGATNYSYQISSCNTSGGVGAAISAISISNGNASLDGTNFNRLSWTPGSSSCTVIWRKTGSAAYVFVTTTLASTFDDFGTSITTSPPSGIWAWIPTLPPVSDQANWLVTTISSGFGTTTLTLTSGAVTAASSVTVQHDDTAALQAGVTYVQNSADLIASGGATNTYDTLTAPCLLLNNSSRYLTSSEIDIGTVLNLCSAGRSSVEQQSPYNIMFNSTFAYRVYVSNIDFIGGSTQWYLTNPNSNNGIFSFSNVNFASTTNWAVQAPAAFSTRFQCYECGASNVNGMISSATDEIIIYGGWWSPGYMTIQADRGWVTQSKNAYDQRTIVHGVTAVPAVVDGSGTVLSSGVRWFDVYGELSLTGFRAGGEGGGIATALVTSTLSSATSPTKYAGAVIGIHDSWVWAPSGQSPIMLNGIPASISYSGNRGPDGNAIIGQYGAFNFATALSTWKTATSVVDATPYINYVIDAGAGRFSGALWPAAVTPYVRALSLPGQQLGTATNDNACTGCVGETMRQTGTTVSYTSGVAGDCTATPITLTPGDWNVQGNLVTIPAGGTTTSSLIAWIGTTSATLPAVVNGGVVAQGTAGASIFQGSSIGPVQFQVAAGATQTVYLSASITFAVSTLTATCSLWARRAR